MRQVIAISISNSPDKRITNTVCAAKGPEIVGTPKLIAKGNILSVINIPVGSSRENMFDRGRGKWSNIRCNLNRI